MPLRLLALAALALATVSGAHAEEQKGKNPMVLMSTSLGDIKLELDAAKAPITVQNFLDYAKAGHYDGTIFHRVIAGFMIQGGGFDRDLKQKTTRAPIRNEAEQAVKAGLKNETGTIAMARTAEPHSATAQFYINVANNAFLDWGDPASRDGVGYAAFGKVVSGLDVVMKISRAETGPSGMFPRDVPRETVLIEKVTLLPAK